MKKDDIKNFLVKNSLTDYRSLYLKDNYAYYNYANNVTNCKSRLIILNKGTKMILLYPIIEHTKKSIVKKNDNTILYG